MQFAVGIKVL